MAEDHQEVLTAIAEGPEAATRVTRHFLEEWLNHSRRALQDASVKISPSDLQFAAQVKDVR
jgi:hypothetical protein